MQLKDYEHCIMELHSEAHRITTEKRPAYTIGSEDVLKNFKRVADRLGLTPMQVWGVYFLKHVDSLTAYAKDKDIPQAEAMIGRFADAMNYLDLGYALMKEGEKSGAI